MEHIIDDIPYEVFDEGVVTVAHFIPDFNDLPWQAISHLAPGLPNPGRNDVIAALFKHLMANARVYEIGTVYVNPASLVSAPSLNAVFLKRAYKAQRSWFQQLNDVFFSAARVKGTMAREHPIIRQLMHTGVMVIDCKHRWPNQWPKHASLPPKHNLVGQQFGLLMVKAMLPAGRCQCHCRCGKETIVFRKHLLTNSTKSCGCLKAKLDARRQAGRKQRGWIQSGQL